MELYLFCYCVVLLCCHLGSGREDSEIRGQEQIDMKMHRRQADEEYEDINNDSESIFESTRLPMLDGTIDYRYLPFVGNGHIATTIYSDAIYVNGVFNGRLGESHRARIPSSNAIQVDFASAQDRNEATKLYSLDVLGGKWKARLQHPDVTVDVSIYAHQHYHHLLVTRVTAKRPEGIDTGREFEFTVTNNRGEPSEDIDFSDDEECSGINVPELTCKYITGTIKETEWIDSERIRVHVFYTSVPNRLTLPASSGVKSWLYVTSIDTDEQKARTAYAMLRDIADTIDFTHLNSWDKYWNAGRIEIRGNNMKLRKVLYGSQYYIRSSLPAPDTDQYKNEFHGVSPGGPGRGAFMEDFQGHVFWDMETWIFPTMLLFHPEGAKEMLNYRINRMNKAYERANENGYEGLQFPWESALTGLDVTPDMCIACRENAHHVTADIAFAARQYVAATRDLDWLKRQDGCDFIIDMAKFWVSRAKYNRGIDRYNIRDVMSPDEYHNHVDDSVYTNVAASLSIHMANYTACLCDRPTIPDDWYDVASKLILLYDEDREYHPVYQGYSPDDLSFNEISNKTNNMVKQADAVLLGFPFMFQNTDVDRKARENDLHIYRDVTDPDGPSMTWAMFSIGYREIGNDQQRDDTFLQSYMPYVLEPFKVWTESSTGVGATNFLTGMGGFLQAVMFGYGGFRLLLESLYFNATIPPDSSSLVFLDLDYMGSRLNLRFSKYEMKIEVLELSTNYPLELELFDDDMIVTLIKGSEDFVYQMQAGRLFTTAESGCPLPIDNIYPTTSAGSFLRVHRTHLSFCLVITSLLLCWYAALRR